MPAHPPARANPNVHLTSSHAKPIFDCQAPLTPAILGHMSRFGNKVPPGMPPYHIQITDFLLSEYAAGRIPVAQHIADTYGVSRPYVHMIRSRLVQAGKLPISPRGRLLRTLAPEERLEAEANRRARVAMKAATKPLVEEIAAAGKEVGLSLGEASRPFREFREDRALFSSELESGTLKAMTADQRRIFLSEVAKRTDRDEIKVSAIAALNRLDASLRTSDVIGPKNPLTQNEALTRLRDIRLAIEDIFGGGSAASSETPVASGD